MMKKHIIAVILLTLFVFYLTACSGQVFFNKNSENNLTADPLDSDKVKLVIAADYNIFETEYYGKHIIAFFQKFLDEHPNVELEFLSIGAMVLGLQSSDILISYGEKVFFHMNISSDYLTMKKLSL